MALVRFVFSALYNESAEYLDHFVGNFLAHTDHQSHLYVNLSPKSKACEDQVLASRVTVFRGGFDRQAFGHTLLAGHMECFAKAVAELPEFEYLITVASNSLFFRCFDAPQVLYSLESSSRVSPTVPVADFPDGWYWDKMRTQTEPCKVLTSKWDITSLINGQIEGRIAQRSDWQLIDDVHSSLAPFWTNLQAPLEEVIPTSVIHTLGSGQTINICYNRFVEAKQTYRGGFVKCSDLVSSSLPDSVCMMKWFERSILSPETLQVVSIHGLELTNWLNSEPRDSRSGVEQELMLGSNYHSLLRIRPKINLISEASAVIPQASSFQLIAQRQIVDCVGQPCDRSSAFFFLEDTGVPLCLKTKMNDGSDLFVHCYFAGSSQKPESVTSPQLQAYLYFPIPSCSPLRIAVDASVHGIDPIEILNNLCLFDGLGFGLRQPFSSSVGFHEFSFEVLFDTSACVAAHIGFPVFLGSSLRLRMHQVI
ncbi:MAG: hypothetical protein ACKO2F_11140 [Cyanobacteriota bacterium]